MRAYCFKQETPFTENASPSDNRGERNCGGCGRGSFYDGDMCFVIRGLLFFNSALTSSPKAGTALAVAHCGFLCSASQSCFRRWGILHQRSEDGVFAWTRRLQIGEIGNRSKQKVAEIRVQSEEFSAETAQSPFQRRVRNKSSRS